MIVKYTNFEVRNTLNEAPNVDNFWKTSYEVFDKNGKFIEMLTHSIMNLNFAKGLMSGNEDIAIRALLGCIRTLKERANSLESVL